MAVDTTERHALLPPDARIRVVVVSSQPVIRAGLRAMLTNVSPLVIAGDAATTNEAITLMLTQGAAVVVLDPDGDEPDLGAIEQLTDAGACVLVFTGATDPELHSRSVGLGALGVVQKHQSGDTLRRAIERVHAGEVWLDRHATARVLRGIRRRDSNDPEALKIASLTGRERQVTALIGSGLKNDAIAERLSISPATVRNHLTSILGKLELADRFELAFYASRHGLLEDAPTGASRQLPRASAGRPVSGFKTLTGRTVRLHSGIAADSGKKRSSEP